MLFAEGDSLVTVLLTKSLMAGEPQDWAMSPALFIPETAVYAGLSAIGLGVRETLTMNVWVNFLALYAAIRVVSGSRRHSRNPVFGAVLAFSAFCLLALLDGGEGRTGFQLASELAMTTHYSATVIGAVLLFGLARRFLDTTATDIRSWRWGFLAICLTSFISTLSNPLFAAWATLPVIGVLLTLRWGRLLTWRPVGLIAVATVGGSSLGMLARVPLSEWIVAESRYYFRIERWPISLEHYRSLVTETSQTPTGAASLLLMAALWVVSGVVAVLLARRRASVPAFVAVSAVLVPAIVLFGMVLMGTESSRYLQPFAFMPPLTLTLASLFWSKSTASPLTVPRWILVGISSAVALSLLFWSLPRAVQEATRTDPDLACVVSWVNTTDRFGAGQFWTARAPKAYLNNPPSIVQVDHQFNIYTWLTNRTDSVDADVTFVITDSMSYPFEYPQGISENSATTINCGRYTIHDFGQRTIPLGFSWP